MRQGTLRWTVVGAGLCIALGGSGIAHADCVDGVRNATPAEWDFAARAGAALAAALPAPIPNSERMGAPYDFSAKPTLSFCKGDKEGAFSSNAGGRYLYKFPKADADRLYAERKAVEKQIDDMEKLPAEKEADHKQLLTQMRAAYDSAPRRSRKDPPFTAEQQAQVDRAMAEGRKLEDAANKLLADHRASVKPQAEELRAKAKKLETFPQDIRVNLAMNVDRFPEAGGTTSTFGTPSAGRSAGLKVHNVVLSVEGPEGAARQAFFDTVDKGYLQGLIGQPPPDMEASKTRSAAGSK